MKNFYRGYVYLFSLLRNIKADGTICYSSMCKDIEFLEKDVIMNEVKKYSLKLIKSFRDSLALERPL